MNEDLIKKLQEADIFTPVSDEEAAYREANRPPRVLLAEAPHDLATTLCSIVNDLGTDVIFDYLMDGIPVFLKPAHKMSIKELVLAIAEWKQAVGGGAAVMGNKQFALMMIEEYMGEKYDDIEGIA